MENLFEVVCKENILKVNMHLYKGDHFYASKAILDSSPIYCIWYNKEKTNFCFNVFGEDNFNLLFDIV